MKMRSTSEVQKSFRQNLKGLRKKRGLTQQGMAAKLNLSKSAYGRFETGKNASNLDFINQVSQCFGIPIAELLGETD